MTTVLARAAAPVASVRARNEVRARKGVYAVRSFMYGAIHHPSRYGASMVVRAEPEEVATEDDSSDDIFDEGDEDQFEEIPGTYEDAINPRSK